MRTNIYTLPPLENRTWVLGTTVFLSLLCHSLFLSGLLFSLSFPHSELLEDQGISIDLEAITAVSSAEFANASIKPKGALSPEKLAEPEISETPNSIPKTLLSKKLKESPRQRSKKAASSKKESSIKNTGVDRAGINDVKSSPMTSKSRLTQPVATGGSGSPKPHYPELARKRGQEGTVNIRCQVAATGEVLDAAIAKSSGFKLLDEAALKTLLKWRFKPATNNGTNVPGTVIVPVLFKLQ